MVETCRNLKGQDNRETCSGHDSTVLLHPGMEYKRYSFLKYIMEIGSSIGEVQGKWGKLEKSGAGDGNDD